MNIIDCSLPGNVGLPWSPLGDAWGGVTIGLGTFACAFSGCVALQYAWGGLVINYSRDYWYRSIHFIFIFKLYVVCYHFLHIGCWKTEFQYYASRF